MVTPTTEQCSENACQVLISTQKRMTGLGAPPTSASQWPT